MMQPCAKDCPARSAECRLTCTSRLRLRGVADAEEKREKIISK